MTYKAILVQCDAGDAAASRMAAACDLAQLSGAHLIGLHVRAQFELPLGIEVQGGGKRRRGKVGGLLSPGRRWPKPLR